MRQFSEHTKPDPNQNQFHIETLLAGAIKHHHNYRLAEAEHAYRRILQIEPYVNVFPVEIGQICLTIPAHRVMGGIHSDVIAVFECVSGYRLSITIL